MRQLPERPGAESLWARQRALVRLRTRSGGSFTIASDVTPAGLLAIGGLVSSILLSTAVLVRMSVRAADRRRARSATIGQADTGELPR